MKNARISGSGSYLPERELTNTELEKTLETNDEWIVSRTGISSRHVANETETTGFMAGKAAARALEASGVSAHDIDLIIAATCTPDHFFPGVACQVQQMLSIPKPIPALDISAACSGFVYAMDIAKQYIATGAAKHVLVIGSESMSRAVDWTDRAVCVLFGDGAGAVVLSATDTDPGIISSVICAQHDKDGLLSYPNVYAKMDKATIAMQGNEVFKLAVQYMTDIVDQVLLAGNLKKSDITWLIPHQANIRIIKAIAKKLDLPMSQVIVTLATQGNTSAASIPLALDYAIRHNQVKRGDVILLESFGGGMTWGAMILQY